MTVAACVLPHVDISWTTFDHLLASVAVEGQGSAPCQRWQWQRSCCDRRAFGDAGKVNTLKEMLRSIPLTPWEVDTDEHWRSLSAQIREALQAAMPRTERPRKEWISERAWEIIKERKPLREALFLARKQLRVARLAVFFYEWARRQRGQRHFDVPSILV